MVIGESNSLNNFAVSSDGLATALQDSASALMEGGNNLEQSVALIAAANKVVQDPSSVGSALRTISLRLRGTSVDVLEQMGEETDGVIESTSKLQEKLKALTGVDILTNTGAYKDTYTILKEIGSVWQDMSNIDQAAALELMAGKNRANTLAAILNNMKDLQGAYESALNSEGSAFRENEQYLDSIQGRIDLLTNAVQTMWMNFIDDRAVKFIVDLATKFVQLIDQVGLLPSLIGGFAAFKFIAAEIGKAFDTTSISAKEFRKTIIDTINAQKEGAAASKMQAEATDEVADAVKCKATADAAETAASTANAAANATQGAANDAVANAAQRQTQAVGKAATQDIIEANTSKQNAEANAQQAASAVGVGSKIKSAFTGVGSALGKIGVGIKAVGAGLGKAALVLLAVEAVSLLMNKAWGWIDEKIHQVENLKEKVKELNDTYKDTKKELSGNITTLTVSSDPGTYKTLLDEFDQLSGGVNILGENLSLTTDQYNRYKEICEKIVGVNPSLAEGYDNATQAISANKGALAQLIDLKKEEARLASAEYVSYGMYSKNSNFESLAQNAINNYQTAQRNLETYIDDNDLAFKDAFKWDEVGSADYKDFAAFILENIGKTKEEIDNILTDESNNILTNYDGQVQGQFSYGKWFENNIADIAANKAKLLNELYKLRNDVSAIGNPEKFATAALTYSGEDFNGPYLLSGYGVDEVINTYRDQLGTFNYEKFASDYGGYIGAYKKYILDNAGQFINDTTTTYDDLTSVLENAQEGLLDVFLEVPNALTEYDQLNAGSKSLITEWIKNSEMFKIDKNTTQAEILTAKQTIIETIQRIADPDTFHTFINGKQVSAQTIIDQLMSIDKSTNFGKYQDSIEELLNYLWNSFDKATQDVFGDKESFAKTLGFEIIFDDSDNISNLRNDISRITGLQGEELEDAIDSLPVTTIEAMLKIDWTAEKTDSLDLQGMIDKALPKKTSINLQTIQTYSSLSESIKSFNEALKTSNELFADGAKTTEDYYNSLIDLGIDKGKLQEAIDTSTYVVTDAKKLKELIQAKKEEISTNVQLAKAQAQLQYSDVIQSISDQITSTNVLENVNQDLVDSLFDQADALRTLINQYQLLENNLLGATNAFTKFTDAQEMDSQNTYGSTLVEMAQTMYDAIYKTGEVGTAQFWAAVKATVPDDIYAGLMPGDKQISAIKNYLQDNLFADLTLNDESFSIDFNAIERFVKKAQSKGLFSGTNTKSFGLSQTFMSGLEDGEDALKKFADQMGVTEEYVYALFAEIDKYNTDGAGLSMLFQLDTSTTGQLTILNTKLEQALAIRKQLLAQNADLTENTKEIYSLQAQQASVKKQTTKDTSQYLMVANALKNPTKTIGETLSEEVIIEIGLQGKEGQSIKDVFQQVSNYLLTLKEPMAFDLEISKDSIEDSIAQLESTFGKEELKANLDMLNNGETKDKLTIDESILQQYGQLLNIDQLIGNALAENFTTTETFLSEIAENTAIMAGKETAPTSSDNGKTSEDTHSGGGGSTGEYSDAGHKKTSEDTIVVDNESIQSIYQEYKNEIDKLNQLGFDPSQTIFGNVDTNNRQVLEWTDENLNKYKDAIKSWGYAIDDLAGSISTVMGTSAEYDGIEIAFTPILQTSDGAKLLDADTVKEYIWGLIDKASADGSWTNEELFALDAEGLEFDGQLIKGLIADIGETAIQTGEAMHYTGLDGSIAQAFEQVADVAREAGISADEFILRLEDGTEVAVNVKAVADTASAKETGQEITDEVAKTIEGVTFDEDKLYQAYSSPDEAIKALEDIIKKEGELYELNQDEALVLGFHVDEGSVLTAGNALDYIKKKYNDLYATYGLHNPQTIEPVSVSTYSQLQGDVASFNELMSQNEEIIANNTEVTQEYKDALLALGVATTDLEDCFGGTNKLVVKNVDKLEDAVKAAKKNTAQNIKLAKAQARLKYYDLYKELHTYTTGLEYTSDGYAILTDEQRQHIDSLRAEMASVNSAIGQFSLLELQLLGVANAYIEYQNAQKIDSENDYSSQAESMVATFANALNTGDLGSASARAAMLGLVPDEVYKDLDTFEEKMDAVAKYFNEGELTKYFTIEFSDDGNVSSVETTVENLKQFFENGKEKGLFTGDWEHFDIADNVTSLEQFADTMGITEEVAYAMFEALEKHDAGNLFDPSNILEKFTSGDLEYQALRNAQALSDLEYQLATGQISIQEYENKMYGLQGQLKSGQLNYKQYTQAVKDLRTQLDQGKITEEEYNNVLYGLAEQHSKLTEQAYEEVTAYNEKTAALEAAKKKLEEYYKILEDGGEVNPEDITKTKDEIEQLQQELEGLEEPTDMTINLAMEEVQEQIDDFKGQIQKSVKKGDKVAINVQAVIQKVENSGFDLTSLGLTKNPDGTWDGVVDFLTSMRLSDDEDTVNKVIQYLNLVDQEHTLDLLLGSESSTVETLLQSINDILTAIGDKLGVNYTLSVKTGTAQSNVKTLKNTIDSIKPTKNVTIWTTIKQKGANLLTKPIGAVSANGTAHVQGTAHKSGSWGAPKTETALVGELGTELVNL